MFFLFQVWIFGDLWCSIWLAVDVWMCTASILNLCAISLDRYVAVTRPVNYPSIMSSSRAKILIAGVWVLSFVICFPPLVGWKDSKLSNDSSSSSSLPPFSGSGTVRIRGSHTVVTNELFPNGDDKSRLFNITEEGDSIYVDPNDKNVIFYHHTNYSEHFLKRNPKFSETDDGEKIYRPYINLKDIEKVEYTSIKNEVVPNQTEEAIDYEESNYIKSPIYKYHANVTYKRRRKRRRRRRKTESAESSAYGIFKRSIQGSTGQSNRIASFSGVPVVSVSDINYPGQILDDIRYSSENSEVASSATSLPTADVSSSTSSPSSSYFSSQCPWTCELTSDTGYVIYSALGSFFIPMGVMLFFYWRIYRAAVQTTRAINQGFRTTKGKH